MPSRLAYVPGQTGRLPKSCSAAPPIRCRLVAHWEQFDESTRFGTSLFSSHAAKLRSFRAAIGLGGHRGVPPVWVMSTVCARWFTVSSVTFTGNTIFLRGEVRWFSMGRLLSRVERSRKSYWSYHPNKFLSRAELLTVFV